MQEQTEDAREVEAAAVDSFVIVQVAEDQNGTLAARVVDHVYLSAAFRGEDQGEAAGSRVKGAARVLEAMQAADLSCDGVFHVVCLDEDFFRFQVKTERRITRHYAD